MTGVHPLTKAAKPSTSPTMTTFVFIAAPPDHIANDFLTIKRNGFTKVTKRKPGSCSQNRERRLGVPPSRFGHKPFSEPRRLSPSECCEVVRSKLPTEAKMRQSHKCSGDSPNPNGSDR